jgi:hypothetical protein
LIAVILNIFSPSESSSIGYQQLTILTLSWYQSCPDQSTPGTKRRLISQLHQVAALMAMLEARSVVGLAGAAMSGGGGDEEDPMLDEADAESIFRITAIKNR